MRVASSAELLPRAANRLGGELGGVVVDPDRDPAAGAAARLRRTDTSARTLPGRSRRRRRAQDRHDRLAAPRSRAAGHDNGPDELWVADFTYLRTWRGPVFLSFVLDVWSRHVVGWQLASNMRTTLVLDALRMALSQRRHGADVELIHHSADAR